MAAVSNLTISLDRTGILEAATKALVSSEVMAGIPGDGTARKPVEGEKQPATNAVIGYVQEFGDDEKHIPPRPFLLPGIDSVRNDIIGELVALGIIVMNGGTAADIRKGFSRIGLICQNAVRKKLTDGPFAPLSPRTIQERAARGRKGAKQYLKLTQQGVPVDVLNDPGVGLVTPLVDTGQLRNSITYVVAKKGER